MSQLTEVRTDPAGRTYYEPILTKIVTESTYNRGQQFGLDGIDGFWDKGRLDVPPQGTVAWFTLASKPKVGPNAKPGSRYLDIIAIERATDADKANYEPPVKSGRYNGPPAGSGQQAQAQAGEPLDSRITRAQAINNRFTRFAALVGLTEKRWEQLGITAEQMQVEMAKLEYILLVMDTGELPKVDTDPAKILEEAEQLDQQAEEAISEPEIVDGQEVESLPW
jgi:hypothetical protein